MRLSFQLVIVFSLVFFFTEVRAQKSTSDSLKSFTINLIERAIKKGNIKKIAVWDFTDINKENSVFGSHIAELVSVYATYVDAVVVMDRQNLKSLIKEHKLKSDGFIDQNTIMELGKFSGVDAVIVGDAIVTGNDFEVVIKILETNQAGTIAADDQYFPIDARMASKLGIPTPESNSTTNIFNPNRGFNRPLNSNEQINNSGTVNKDCERLNFGDYCFYNNSKSSIMITIIEEPNNSNNIYTNIIQVGNITLKPTESKCLYNLTATKTYLFEIIDKEIEDKKSQGGYYGVQSKVLDKGIIKIEKCKSKTYSFR